MGFLVIQMHYGPEHTVIYSGPSLTEEECRQHVVEKQYAEYSLFNFNNLPNNHLGIDSRRISSMDDKTPWKLIVIPMTHEVREGLLGLLG